MTKKIKVYLGWLSTGVREDIHIYLLRDLQDRYGDKIEFVLPDECVHRILHDFARNEVVDEFLASDCDVLWFLDSDVVPPNHVCDLIAHHWDKWQAAGAPYPVYMQTPGTDDKSICFTVYKGLVEDKETSQRAMHMATVPQEGTEFVDALATGCLFLKREVFKNLEKPYFEFKFNKETRRIVEGEDLGFAFKLYDQGIKFFVDYSMACDHYKRVGLLQMSNYAMRRSNAAVIEYDAQIKDQMQKVVQSVYEKGIEKGRSEAPAPQTPKNKSGLILPNSFRT